MQHWTFSLATLVLLLLFQWLLGGVLLGRAARARRSEWSLPARAFVRGRVAAISMLAVILVLLLRGDPWRALLVPQLPWLALLALTGTAATAGAWLVLFAGLLERRGALREAGTLVRFGGRLMAPGTLALLVLLVARLALAGPPEDGLLFPLLAAAGLATAGFAGLLAGLTRKSRPTGPFAVLLYLIALAALHGMA